MKVMESIKNQKLPTCIVNRLNILKERGIEGMLESTEFMIGYLRLMQRQELYPWISTLSECYEIADDQWDFIKSKVEI